VIIHCLAFTSLYLALYDLTMTEVVSSHRQEAELSLDQLASTFQAVQSSRTLLQGREKIRWFLANRRSEVISIFGASGSLVATSQVEVDPVVSTEAAAALAQTGGDTKWFTRPGSGHVLSGVRILRNESPCQSCHARPGSVLGAIQLTHDDSGRVASAARRVRVRLALLVAVWGILVLAMVRLRDVVIGRPIERIESALARAVPQVRARRGDLDDLATRLDSAIWSILEQREARERSLNAREARAEQLASVGELAASLTHEIRNPLAGVSSALDALLADSKSASKERSATKVYRRMKSELERMNTTLSGLLSLARPRPPRRVPVDMARVSEEVVEMFRARAAARKISLDLEAAAGLPSLELDRGMMVQLLLNLLTNALQAIEGEGKIRVGVGPFPNRDGVVLTVTDTGRGIAAAEVERIFEPFFTTKEHGTGLGMPICRQIVEQHGGALEIQSKQGAGTTVVVLLPGHRAKGDAAVAARLAG